MTTYVIRDFVSDESDDSVFWGKLIDCKRGSFVQSLRCDKLTYISVFFSLDTFSNRCSSQFSVNCPPVLQKSNASTRKANNNSNSEIKESETTEQKQKKKEKEREEKKRKKMQVQRSRNTVPLLLKAQRRPSFSARHYRFIFYI